MEGCTVLSVHNLTVTCSCTHLSVFDLSSTTFDPHIEFNTLNDKDIRNLTIQNISKYPVPLIIIMIYIAFALIFCNRLNDHKDLPLLVAPRFLD